MVLSPTETKVRRAVALIRLNAADLAACRRDAEAALGGMRTTTFFDRRLPENKSVREKSVQAAAALRRLQKALEKNPDLADRLAQVKGLGGDTEWFEKMDSNCRRARGVSNEPESHQADCQIQAGSGQGRAPSAAH